MKKSRLFIILGIILLAVLAVITLLTRGQTPRNTLSFSSPRFAMSYPKEYSVETDSSGITTFSAPKGEGTDGGANITVTRFGTSKTAKNSLKALARSEFNETASEATINDSEAVVIEGENTSTMYKIYYIYSRSYIWEVNFSFPKGDGLENSVDGLVKTFLPNERPAPPIDGGQE
jgi:ABC-type antimicrobial peptide transport system permease subunit